MKRIISCLIIFMVGITAGQAQNPIPSYNFPVYQRANFQEIQGPRRAKKKVNVTAQCVSGKSLTCNATVWIYSLDLLTIYGPFTISGGETLTVEVDGEEWGVFVESDDHVIVDVWIEEVP